MVMEDTLKRRILAFLLLLPLMATHLLCFVGAVLLSLGLSLWIQILYVYIVGGPLPGLIDSLIFIILLGWISFCVAHLSRQGSKEREQAVWLTSYFRTYPNLLKMGPRLCYGILAIVSIMSLYIQFEARILPLDVDPSPRPPLGENSFLLKGVSEGQRPIGLWTRSQWGTVIFLVSISYILHSSIRFILSDLESLERKLWVEELKSSSSGSCCCCQFLTFKGVLILRNTLYSIPLLPVGVGAYFLDLNGSLTFGGFVLVGMLIGMMAGVGETRTPAWPRGQGLGQGEKNGTIPHFWPIPFIPVLICYYVPLTFFNPGVIKGSPAPTARNISILAFSISVAFAVLFYVKHLVIVQKWKGLNRANKEKEQGTKA